MAEKKKTLLASVALAAGLAVGGVAGWVLGVPGVSSAQTTTVPDAPTTVAPDSGDAGSGTPDPDRPARGDREDCPDKDGSGGGSTEGTGFRGRGATRI